MRYPHHCDSSCSGILVSLESVIKSYRARPVLNVAHLSIAEEERVFISGGNGSGKSTLLRLIARLTTPTHGRVVWSEVMKRLRKGYVPQAKGVNPGVSVAQHLRMQVNIYRMSEGTDDLVSEVTERLDLGQYLQHQVSTLSGGAQRLVSLAGLFCVRPQVAFLDEPFAGLDFRHREAVRAEIEILARESLLILITGHERDDVRGYNRQIRLSQGKLENEG